jgi:hypothetical protein
MRCCMNVCRCAFSLSLSLSLSLALPCSVGVCRCVDTSAVSLLAVRVCWCAFLRIVLPVVCVCVCVHVCLVCMCVHTMCKCVHVCLKATIWMSYMSPANHLNSSGLAKRLFTLLKVIERFYSLNFESSIVMSSVHNPVRTHAYSRTHAHNTHLPVFQTL